MKEKALIKSMLYIGQQIEDQIDDVILMIHHVKLPTTRLPVGRSNTNENAFNGTINYTHHLC